MEASVPIDLQWLDPWVPVDDGDPFVTELSRETSAGHPLYCVPAIAVARRIDCDDVLFRVQHPFATLAVVHLTWISRPEPPPEWPATVLFLDWQQWIRECLLRDAREYNGRQK